MPSDWEESFILNLCKGKGEALDGGNYHGLKLTDQTGFIAVREMSERNKISQGQGIVREFYQVSGKFRHLAKLMKNVMEFHIMSGKSPF